MKVQKLLASQPKTLSIKTPYQKPVYKSYRELLQLDRPRKKIEYQSSDEEQDFLEKLLREEQDNSKKKKKKKPQRKSTSQGTNRPKPEKVVVKKEKEPEEPPQPKKKNKYMDQIELFLAQTKEVSADKPEQNIQEKPSSSNPEKSSKQQKRNKMKSVASKVFQRSQKSKPLMKKDIVLNNPIFIDTKSMESPPILFSSSNHIFNATIPLKHRTSAYQQLLTNKLEYERQYKTPSLITNTIHKQSIQHKVEIPLGENFTFEPSIEPINPNWRISLAFNPLPQQRRARQDRQQFFKNEKEVQRFVKSLRQLSRFRR